MKQEHYLDPHDKMRLEAARGRNAPSRPTVSEYNQMIQSRSILGVPIKQISEVEKESD